VSLRPAEATLIGKELERELRGGAVQQVAAPTTTRVYVELRVPGRTATILLCCDERAARLSAVDKRPPNPPAPPAWQSVLRRELVGARLLDVESVEARRLVLLHFRSGAEQVRTLLLEYGESAGIALTTREGRLFTFSSPFRSGFRHGATWTPPEDRDVPAQPSRLASDFVELRLSRAAEALFGAQETVRWQKAQRSPLEARLKRLERTRLKVLDEANRTGQAEAAKREGELLAQNLSRLTRGATWVTLPLYGPEGTTEHTLTLDPARTPKQEVERRFHQYRRLLRGVEFAQKRLVQLEEERRSLAAQLEALANDAPIVPLAAAKKGAGDETPLLPYKLYQGHREHPVWVGRGAAHNDTLTFRTARPWHVWFHARGVPGAHVVVPLEKNATLTQELLLDAAHLALHHSDAKGEPRGEVSYVPVKYVRKPKGGVPGAVSFTQEKTLMLRLEPERLARLLATERLERS
jgi:predicted ribosome quality control (RQC) complex YloA/Tae2 family protein